MIRTVFIVPQEGETVEQAFDRQYPYNKEKNNFGDMFGAVYVVECRWIKSTKEN